MFKRNWRTTQLKSSAMFTYLASPSATSSFSTDCVLQRSELKWDQDRPQKEGARKTCSFWEKQGRVTWSSPISLISCYVSQRVTKLSPPKYWVSHISCVYLAYHEYMVLHVYLVHHKYIVFFSIFPFLFLFRLTCSTYFMS